MNAPLPPNEAPRGYAWRIYPDPEWVTDPAIVRNRRCRYGSPKNGYCRRGAVAALDRRRTSAAYHAWYGYCEEHLYGRWIEDGRVVGWRLREIGKEG